MNMQELHHFTFYLTLVYLEDKETGDVTAFYAQFPDATAQGRDKEEAKLLLNEIFPLMMEEKGNELVDAIDKQPFQEMTYERQIISA